MYPYIKSWVCWPILTTSGRRAEVLKIKAESHANQYVGCGGETAAATPVWEVITTRAWQPWGFWPVNVQQTSEPAMAPPASCPQECRGTKVGHKDSQGTSVAREAL